MTAMAPRAASASIRAAATIVAATAAVALLGAALALATLLGGHEVRRLEPAARWSAAASFGPVVVERVERRSVTAAGHAGDHDPADRSDELHVGIRLTNRLDRPVLYSPGQFRLVLPGTGTTVSPVEPNPPPGAIPAHTTLEQELSFLVAVRRSTFALTFDDVRAAGPLTIRLGVLASPALASGKE